jgi:hypothetical protein
VAENTEGRQFREVVGTREEVFFRASPKTFLVVFSAAAEN